MPPADPGVGRRAIVYALLAWVPIAAWALLRARFGDVVAGESLLQHYGVHVPCLVVIPLLILGEASLHKATLRFVPQFVRNGLVGSAGEPRFAAALEATRRWRDRSLPWVLALGIAIGWAIVDRPDAKSDTLSWAVDGAGSVGFGGLWYA